MTERAEKVCRRQLEHEGWTILHGGWPDFLCMRRRETMAVEVKRVKGDHLTGQQRLVANRLANAGVRVFRWTKDLGLVPIRVAYPGTGQRPAEKVRPPRRFFHPTEVTRLVRTITTSTPSSWMVRVPLGIPLTA